MSWLEKRAMEAAQSLADMTGKRVDEETSDVAEAIEAVAREFAERALRQWVTPTESGKATMLQEKAVAQAIAAAEREE